MDEHGRQQQEPYLLLAALGWTAAALHAGAAVGHWSYSALHGAAFAVYSLMQLGWAAWVAQSRSALSLRVGIVLSLAAVAIWALSRTAGLPEGPQAWEPESVGFADLAAVATELTAAILALALLRGRDGLVARLRGATYLVLVAAGIVVLTAGSHGHS